MRGYLFKRYKKSWTAVINLGRDPATGKYRQKWYSFKNVTRRQAEQKLAELITQFHAGNLSTNTKLKMSEFLNRWLRDYPVSVNLAPRTLEGYESIIRYHLIPAFGHIRLDRITTAHLQEYYTAKAKNISAQTVHHHHTLLHKIFETAIDWNLLNRNPAARARPPRVDTVEMSVWNETEIATFLESIRETPYYVLFYTALWTGMRESELLGLRWGDINTDLKLLSVNRAMHKLRTTGEVVYRQPKSDMSRRTIYIPTALVEVLDRHRAGQTVPGDVQVFTRPDGTPLLRSSVSHAWTRLVKRSGLRRIRLHDTRHTHASILLMNGVHYRVVQERIGHSDVNTLLDIYGHFIRGGRSTGTKDVDEVLEELTGRKVIH